MYVSVCTVCLSCNLQNTRRNAHAYSCLVESHRGAAWTGNPWCPLGPLLTWPVELPWTRALPFISHSLFCALSFYSQRATGEKMGRIKKELLQAFLPSRNWKINLIGCPGCRIPHTPYPTPLLRPCLRQGLRGLPKQLNRLSCHCIPQFGTKLTPIQIFQLLHS